MAVTYGGLLFQRLRTNFTPASSALGCRCRAYGNNAGGDSSRGPKSPPGEALLRALAKVSRTDGRISQSLNVVLGGYVSEEQWKALDAKVNLYPMVRRFTAIGKGGDDFAKSMVYAVETVLQEPIPRDWVTKRLSSRGKYISVRIGPVLVNSGDQVRAVYNAMKRDVRMKYFL